MWHTNKSSIFVKPHFTETCDKSVLFLVKLFNRLIELSFYFPNQDHFSFTTCNDFNFKDVKVRHINQKLLKHDTF